MSITVTTDVVCDYPHCGAWTHGTVSNRARAAEARLVAGGNGWVRRTRGGRVVDLCPRHASS